MPVTMPGLPGDPQDAMEQPNAVAKLADGEARISSSRMTSRFVVKPQSRAVDPPEVFCCRYSPDDTSLACSYADGSIKVFSADTGHELFALNKRSDSDAVDSLAGLPSSLANHPGIENDDLLKAMKPPTFPTTTVRWRPAASASTTKNILISVNADSDGKVQHWHIKSGKCLHTIEEQGNQIFCLDYFRDGSSFATAGRDYKVRIYDEATKRLSQVLDNGDAIKTSGHSNRVFSVKFHPENPNLLISAGWDNTVQVWDLRKGASVKSIFGPYICGDAVDINYDGTQILTGSYRTQDTLQLWDFASGDLIKTCKWRPEVGLGNTEGSHLQGGECMAFAAQFSRGNTCSRYAIAGGSQQNEVKVFDTWVNSQTGALFDSLATGDGKCDWRVEKGNWAVMGAVQTPKPVFAVDFNHSATQFAIGGADGSVRVMNMPAAK